MYEEQRLMASGLPFSEAFSLCSSLRREGNLDEFMESNEKHHTCKCGGNGNCPDCPNRNK